MTTLYRYQPVIIPGPDGTEYRPSSADPMTNSITELCELDGWRYVAIPEGISTEVPPQLTTWEVVNLTPELRETIKTISPHCQLARERFVSTIHNKYSLDDELYYARIATGSLLGTYTLQEGETGLLTSYQDDVEAARTTLHEQYAQFGL